MKISFNWLMRYADIYLSPEELSELLTDCGLEVEGLEKFQSVEGGLEGVVIGEVLTCEKHPNADKLTLTTVSIDKDTVLPIVCGAPNVSAGQKVLVATVGTVLNMGGDRFEIKKAKIRGEVSEGMICAEDELGLGPLHEGIMVLEENVPVGTKASEYFNIEEDYVYEIGLTPNRTDATSHIGVARDVVAVLNTRTNEKQKINIPSVEGFRAGDKRSPVELIIEDVDKCPRFSGLAIEGLEVKESPDWLKNSLRAIGIRPVNNVVDITNYVLMETGQPLHAYDISAIKGGKVIVRGAHKGEKFITLDGIERDLSEEDLMICNAEEGMCIAGVFGGVASGVTGDTRGIFLESANFDPVSVRKTSRLYSLQTDASFRFERGADPNITVYALKRAAMMITEIAGGNISSGIQDHYPKEIKDTEVKLSYKNTDRLIGKVIERPLIKSILTDLDIRVTAEDHDGLMLSVPTFKVDVTREADVIEEILRIYGYGNIEIPEAVRSSLSFIPRPDRNKLGNMIADMLTARGFSEIMNNSLTRSGYVTASDDLADDENVHMLNPLSSDLDVMRQTMLFGVLEAVAHNQNRKITDLRLYEFGRTYMLKEMQDGHHDVLGKYGETEVLAVVLTGNTSPESWRDDSRRMDIFDLKAIIQGVFIKLGISVSTLSFAQFNSDHISEGFEYTNKGNTLLRGGLVSGKWNKAFDLKQEVFFAELNWDLAMELVKGMSVTYKGIPKYPEVRRDLALLLSREVTFEQLYDLAFKTEKKFLQSVNLFDIYEGEKIGEGQRSYALSFTLLDKERTLTDKAIDKAMDRLIKAYKDTFQAIIR